MVYLSENGVYSWPPKAGVRVGLVKILFFKFCWGVRIKCSPACGLVDKLWAHSLFIHGKMIPEIIFPYLHQPLFTSGQNYTLLLLKDFL